MEQSQNIPRDDSTLASIEKSALDEYHSLMEEIVDEVTLSLLGRKSKPTAEPPAPMASRLKNSPSGFDLDGKCDDNSWMELIDRDPHERIHR